MRNKGKLLFLYEKDSDVIKVNTLYLLSDSIIINIRLSFVPQIGADPIFFYIFPFLGSDPLVVPFLESDPLVDPLVMVTLVMDICMESAIKLTNKINGLKN